MFKFYFKCFMIKGYKVLLNVPSKSFACPEAICKYLQCVRSRFPCRKEAVCSEMPRGTRARKEALGPSDEGGSHCLESPQSLLHAVEKPLAWNFFRFISKILTGNSSFFRMLWLTGWVDICSQLVRHEQTEPP